MKLSKQIEKHIEIVHTIYNWEGNKVKAVEQILSTVKEYIAEEIVGEEKENIDFVDSMGICTHDYETDAMNDLRKQQLTKLDKDFKE